MQLTSPETTPIKTKSPVVCDLTSPADGVNDSDWEDAKLQRSLFPEEVNEGSGEPREKPKEEQGGTSGETKTEDGGKPNEGREWNVVTEGRGTCPADILEKENGG